MVGNVNSVRSRAHQPSRDESRSETSRRQTRSFTRLYSTLLEATRLMHCDSRTPAFYTKPMGLAFAASYLETVDWTGLDSFNRCSLDTASACLYEILPIFSGRHYGQAGCWSLGVPYRQIQSLDLMTIHLRSIFLRQKSAL
jgi:hypothetical protein